MIEKRVGPFVAWCAMFCLTFLFCASTGAWAMEQDSDKPVLQRSTDSSWYSASNEELVAVLPYSRENIDVSDRAKSVKGPDTPQPNTPWAWNTSFFDLIGDFFRVIVGAWVYIIFGIILLVLVAAAVYLLMNAKGSRGFRRVLQKQESTVERDQAKITDLPFEIEQSTLGLLDQAGVYRSRGEYSKAIIYLFSHVLVELDAAGHIRLARGKTNRVYLRELGSRETERKFTSYLVRWFEHVFFGKHDIDPDVFEKIWSQLPAFDRQIKSVVTEKSHA